MPFHLTDTEWVLIVVATIYFFESACWVRRDALCLGTLLGRFRALPSPAFMGNDRHKLVLGNLSPLARCFVCETWPMAVSPEGICLAEGEAAYHVGFEAIAEGLAVVENELHRHDGTIVRCASKEQAKQLAAMLAEAVAASEADRGKLIGEHLDRWTDSAAVTERFAELKKLIAPLRLSGSTLFMLAFVLGPVLYYSPWRPARPAAIIYFIVLFSTWMLAVWDYAICRQQLLGERFSARWRHTGMLMLSPASAMRSSESLLRHGMAEFHPLAVAAALTTKARFAALARPMLLALENPIPDEVPVAPDACRIDAWFRKKLLKRLHSLLRRVQIDPAELLRPAAPLGESRSYCPRCHNQFVLAEGSCSDCKGMGLVAYGR